MAGRFTRLMSGLLGTVRAPVTRAVTFSGDFLRALQVQNSNAGTLVTADTALQCMTALACVQAIACGVSMLPMDWYRRRPDGGRDLAGDVRSLSAIRDAPNDWQTWLEWIETMLMHAVLTGDGVSYVNRVSTGRIIEIIPLLPGQYQIHQHTDFTLEYRLLQPDGSTRIVPRDQVFHLRAPSWNSWAGLDATRMAREAIGLALATEEAHARLHGNGTRPGGILTSDSPRVLTDEEARAIGARWKEINGGLANAGRTAVLGGGLKFQPITMSGVDAQHLETRRFQIEEICRAFGIFPAMVGHSDKAATYASAEQFFLANVIYSLGRWTERLEQRLRMDLLTPQERALRIYPKFSVQALLRGDAKARAEFYTALITMGVLTRNEARGLEDLNPLDGLDEPLRPLNLATQAEAEAALAAKLAPPPAAAAAGTMAAVRAMLRQYGHGDPEMETRIGRILSAANEQRITNARDELSAVLAQLGKDTDAAA